MANHLAQQTSPYLRQHADNPVEWYPWGKEALDRARDDDKPILLSIGYSACHWCHVMAHESFEDAQVAEVMNRLFVNIKVDREERPDLDQIYQIAHQMLAQRPGGWPLTVFLTPEGTPFFSGTYFPKEPRYGMPGFVQLCERVAQAWREQRSGIEHQNAELLAAFSRSKPTGPARSSDLSPAPVRAALAALKSSFDPRNGGFGGAPKFPHPAEIEFCLRRFAASGDREALHLAIHTLERMALGGIYDQLGGGFSRYSVDASWMIPHFEKMLYDNGPLLRLYADAWTITSNALFARVVEETAAWMQREMQSPEGGYYSSLDADSEHEEGKFYVWDRDEVRDLLDPEQYAVASQHYGLEGPPNFEGRHWHLNVARPLAELGARPGWEAGRGERLLASARNKLFDARERRARPGRDDKVLTSWNALAIAGMARAGRVFDRRDWVDSAFRAFAFLRASMWKDGKLLATYKDGRAHLNGYLDDYSFLLAAAIELVQADFDSAALEFAVELGDALLQRFQDEKAGGFFFTANDHERLLTRLKPIPDGAMPSGNGVAAHALQRLSFLVGEERFARAAERVLLGCWSEIEQAPGAHASLLMALEEYLRPTRTIILRGPREPLEQWRRGLACMYLPDTLVVAIAGEVSALPTVLAKPVSHAVNAWVCEGATCLAPVQSHEMLAALVCRPREDKAGSEQV